MKLVTFLNRGQTGIGALITQGGRRCVLDYRRAAPGLPSDMLGFLCGGEQPWSLARRATLDPDERALFALEDVALLAPIPRPGKIICVGHNYHDHVAKASTLEEYPTV